MPSRRKRKDAGALAIPTTRYGRAIASLSDLDRDALRVLVADALYLWEAVLCDAERIRRLKNLARRTLPGAKETDRIELLVRSLPRKAPPP